LSVRSGQKPPSARKGGKLGKRPVRVFDGGEPGRGIDEYGILVANGYASGDQTLTNGNVQIQVHE
jgi:hypothetical protein